MKKTYRIKTNNQELFIRKQNEIQDYKINEIEGVTRLFLENS